jgi:hypothetical protein
VHRQDARPFGVADVDAVIVTGWVAFALQVCELETFRPYDDAS